MINPNFGSVIGDSYAYIAVPADANQYVAAAIDGKIYGTSLASPDGHAMIGVSKPGTYTLHNVRNSGMLGDTLFTVTVTEKHKIYGVSYSTPETRAKAFADITEDEFLAISKDIEVGNITSDDLPWKVGDKNTKFTRKAYTNGTYKSNYNESGDTVPFHLTIADINQNKYKTTRKSAYLFIIPKLFSGSIYNYNSGAFGNWTSSTHKLQSSTNSVHSSTVLYTITELLNSYFSDKLSRALKPLTVDSNCIELSNRNASGRYQSYIEFTDTCTQSIQLFASSDFVDNDLSHRFSIFKDAQDLKDLYDKIINLFELSYPGSSSHISVLLRDAFPLFESSGYRIDQNVYEMMGGSKSDVNGYMITAYNASGSYSLIPGFCAI